MWHIQDLLLSLLQSTLMPAQVTQLLRMKVSWYIQLQNTNVFTTLTNDCICLFVLNAHVAGNSKRRLLLLGAGALASTIIPVNSVLAEGIMVFFWTFFLTKIFWTWIRLKFYCLEFHASKNAGTPANYDSFTDLSDGYSYIYPSDWRVSFRYFVLLMDVDFYGCT